MGARQVHSRLRHQRRQTDKKYWTSVSNQMLVFGYMSRIYGDPRTFGLNVRYNF